MQLRKGRKRKIFKQSARMGAWRSRSNTRTHETSFTWSVSLFICAGKRRPDLFVAQKRGYFVLHVPQRDFVLFPVVGVDTVCGQDYRPVSLVRVNGCRANASVGIDPSHDDRIRFEAGKYFVQTGSVKRA